jgi:hypothetical protein
MKFGSQIKAGLYSEWEKYYIDYSGLKKFLKRKQAAHESKNENNIWDDSDEAEFIKKLQDELTKVSRFQEDKVAELHGQIALYSQEVQELVNIQQQRRNKQNNNQTNTSSGGQTGVAKLGDDEENINRAGMGYDSDDEEDDDDDDLSTEAEETERRFTELEEDLEVLIADVYDLGRFTHLNYTGFIKIVKVRELVDSIEDALSLFFVTNAVFSLYRQKHDVSLSDHVLLSLWTGLRSQEGYLALEDTKTNNADIGLLCRNKPAGNYVAISCANTSRSDLSTRRIVSLIPPLITHFVRSRQNPKD